MRRHLPGVNDETRPALDWLQPFGRVHALRAASRRPTAPSRWTATASGSRTRPCPTAKLAAARPTAFSTVLRPARAAITCRPDGLGRTARRARRPASRRGSRAGRRSRRWAERRVGGHGPDLWGQSVSPPPSVFEAGKARGAQPPPVATAELWRFTAIERLSATRIQRAPRQGPTKRPCVSCACCRPHQGPGLKHASLRLCGAPGDL